MSLRQLYKLQQCYKELEDTKRKLSKSRNTDVLKSLKRQFDNFKEEYNDINKNINEVKNKYTKLDESISCLSEQIKKDEYILYNESDNNIKLIESLQQDIKTNRDNIETMENETIEVMALEEELVNKKNEIKKQVLDIREKFYNKKEEEDIIIKECKENIEMLTNNIAEVEKTIPKDLSNIFNKLKDEKHTAICKVENGVCEGCKISLACETVDNLKNDDITYCDNCGRILFKEN